MISRIVRSIELIEEWLLVLLLFGMIAIAASQVILRNVFDMGLFWGDGSVRVLLLWVAMFGAMVASRNDDHIRIDLIGRLIPESYQKALSRVCCLFAAVFLRFQVPNSFTSSTLTTPKPLARCRPGCVN